MLVGRGPRGSRSAASRTSPSGTPGGPGSASGSASTGFSIHRLRHSCADRLLNEEGFTVPQVAEVLGHSDIKTTMLYLRPAKGKLSDRMANVTAED